MKFFTEKPYQTIIFLLYIIISFVIVWHHEPWFDEAQAWLIARDCNFSQLMVQMKYEGTPALWHIILMPFAKLHIPYFSMQLLHWLIATGIIFLLLFYSPFSLLMKIGITFSYSMIYEYVAKARCYNLAVLIFLGIATIYPKRMEKPLLYAFLIFLLCQIHLICIPAAFGLALVFTWEILFSAESLRQIKNSYFMAILIMALAGLLAFFQIYPPKSANPYMAALEFKIPVARIWENYITSHSGLTSQYSAFQYTEQVKLAAEIGFNIFIVILFLLTIIALRRTNLIYFLSCSFLGIFAIQCLLAEFFPRHSSRKFQPPRN